ncbi:DUF2490 domain-containing protein [Breznakibacter xylanolyticus]|nr:DUF2490 domain-containing protein [Breznakibacter xylanolyticus]MBN2743622.1 DUF2490 domain-containing protein [Marinilabiliaceae bacterium]
MIRATTMVMTIKTWTTIVILMMMMMPATWSQSADFGIWAGIDGEKKLTKRLNAEMNLQARTYDNASSLALWLAETGLNWEANKYIDFSLMYRYIADHSDDDGVESKHRVYGDVKGQIEISRLKLSSRIRYQHQYNQTKQNGTKEKLRNKWELKYNIKECPLTPFASAEWFAPLGDARFDIEAWRYMAGVTWKINKKQALEAAWLGERENGESINLNALSVSWKQKF